MQNRRGYLLQNIGIFICIVIFSFSLVAGSISLSGSFTGANMIMLAPPKDARLAAVQKTSYGMVPFCCSAREQEFYDVKIQTMNLRKTETYSDVGAYEVRPFGNPWGDIEDSLYVWEQGYARYWTQEDTLNVFGEKNGTGQRLIAPGSHGVYDFVICNNASFSIDYTLTITYQNDYDIPLSFRLRKGTKYLAGDGTHWVSAAQLAQAISAKVLSGGEEEYSLDWRWPYYINHEMDKKDTSLGILAANQPVEFFLHFNLYAEQSGPETPDRPIGPPSKTGDETNLIIYAVMMVCSGAGCLFLLLTRRRYKKITVHYADENGGLLISLPIDRVRKRRDYYISENRFERFAMNGITYSYFDYAKLPEGAVDGQALPPVLPKTPSVAPVYPDMINPTLKNVKTDCHITLYFTSKF